MQIQKRTNSLTEVGKYICNTFIFSYVIIMGFGMSVERYLHTVGIHGQEIIFPTVIKV